MAGFTLEVVTPEGVVCRKMVDEVSLPTEEGEVRILPEHRPMAAKLLPGLLSLTAAGCQESFAIDSGFLYLQQNCISVLTDQAVDVKVIDPTEVSTALELAEKALQEAKEKKLDDEVIRLLEAKIKYQVVKKMAKN